MQQCASCCQILSKSVKRLRIYCDLFVFQNCDVCEDYVLIVVQNLVGIDAVVSII